MIALRSLAFNLFFFAWTAFLHVLYLPLLVLPERFLIAGSRLWARGILAGLAFFCGIRHEIRGREHLPEGACIVASKHQSAWDTLIFPLLVDGPCYVFKRELMWVPLFGWYIARDGGIPIDRKGGAKALRRMLAAAQRRAARGRKIVIFPEGTRVPLGERRPYHPGTAALYRHLDLPVVPVAVNSGLFWGRRSFRKYPGTIVLEMLPPIPAGQPRRAFAAALESRIEAATARLIDEARGRAPLGARSAPAATHGDNAV